MSVRHAVLATIHAQDGVVKGRTLLQKKLYFLGDLSDEDYGFSPHYYGPYSELVAQQVEALAKMSAGFIDEGVVGLAGTGGPFGERVRYDLGLSTAGKKVLRKRKDILSPYQDHLDRINGHSIANNVKLMSAAAKAHFIVTEHGPATVKDIQQRALGLGWRVSRDQIQKSSTT